MKFTNLVDASLLIMTIYSLCLLDAGVKKIFKEIYQFYTFYSKSKVPGGWGSWNLQFLVSFPSTCYIPNLIEIGPVLSEKKLLTYEKKISNTFVSLDFYHQLSTDNQLSCLVNHQAKGSWDIRRRRFGLQTNWLSCGKQYSTSFSKMDIKINS